jgi:hypothetical protein
MENEFDLLIDKCFDIFTKKTKDYGTSWRIMRISSMTDQLFIKAKRIKTIQDEKKSLVNDSIEDELVGIVNYSILSLIQLNISEGSSLSLTLDESQKLYKQEVSLNLELMRKKNHDYGQAWKFMRVSSIIDMILMKLIRIKQIENNGGKTLISESVESGYRDIFNYALFAFKNLEKGNDL